MCESGPVDDVDDVDDIDADREQTALDSPRAPDDGWFPA